MNKLTLIFGLVLVLGGALAAQEAPPAPDVTEGTATREVTYLDPNYTRQAARFARDGVTFVNSDVFFRLDAMDADTGLDRIEFSLDEGAFQSYQNPFNLLQEGYRVIRYRGLDNADNVEVTRVLQVFVDNTAPTSVVDTDRALFSLEGTTFASARTRFFINSNDNEGGSGVKSTFAATQLGNLESRGDGSRAVANFFTLTQEGPLNLYHTSLDNVGNLARIRQFNVTIDATAPVVSIQPTDNLRLRDGVYTLIPSEGLTTQDGELITPARHRIGFTALDNLSGVRALYVKINEEDFVQYFEPIEVKGADRYTILVRAEDNVGNISDPVTFVFKVDALPPRSEIQMIDRDGTSVD